MNKNNVVFEKRVLEQYLKAAKEFEDKKKQTLILVLVCLGFGIFAFILNIVWFQNKWPHFGLNGCIAFFGGLFFGVGLVMWQSVAQFKVLRDFIDTEKMQKRIAEINA